MTGAAESRPGARLALPIPTIRIDTAPLADLGRVIATALNCRTGKLDKAVLLTSKSGPVDLGFLDLMLELASPDRPVRPVRATVDVSWRFTDHRVGIDIAARLKGDGPTYVTTNLGVVLEPGSTRSGLVGYSVALLHEPQEVFRRRKGGTRVRTVAAHLRLWAAQRARPIGSIPVQQGSTFLPFQA